MNGAFIGRRPNKSCEFEHKYCVNLMDTVGVFLPGVLQVGVDKSSIEQQQKLDEEYEQLIQDRRL